MYIENITKDLAGKEISCVIKGVVIEKAIIDMPRLGYYYIYQNLKDGGNYENQKNFGYKYAWSAGKGTSSELSKDNINVTQIKLLNSEPQYEIY